MKNKVMRELASLSIGGGAALIAVPTAVYILLMIYPYTLKQLMGYSLITGFFFTFLGIWLKKKAEGKGAKK